jgi:hypothetical protein
MEADREFNGGRMEAKYRRTDVFGTIPVRGVAPGLIQPEPIALPHECLFDHL